MKEVLDSNIPATLLGIGDSENGWMDELYTIFLLETLFC